METLDEGVGDDKDDGEADGEDDLGEKDGPPTSTRNVSGQLFAWVTKTLLLVTGDLGSAETAVSDPRVGVASAVTARHPAKELAVVDDEIRGGELVRVEENGAMQRAKILIQK